MKGVGLQEDDVEEAYMMGGVYHNNIETKKKMIAKGQSI